jgi:hypothetical protein
MTNLNVVIIQLQLFRCLAGRGLLCCFQMNLSTHYVAMRYILTKCILTQFGPLHVTNA